jgi:hypothetical protein
MRSVAPLPLEGRGRGWGAANADRNSSCSNATSIGIEARGALIKTPPPAPPARSRASGNPEGVANSSGPPLSRGRAALKSSRSNGQVEAVFRSSFYVRFGDGWACIGNEGLGRGPLNVPCRGATQDWRSVVRPGSPASVRCGKLDVSGHVIAFHDAPVWSPGPSFASTCASWADGLDLLSRALPAKLPDGGLAPLIRHEAVAGTLVEKAARPAVQALSTWAALPHEDGTEPPVKAVCALVGLGPGLTPSGDDFLAGFMVALRAVGQVGRSSALSQVISENLGLTSPLSAAHLRAAARCGLSEDLDDLLAAILAGDGAAIETNVHGLLRASPHHSPWDALAGITAVLRGLVQRSDCRLE